MPITLHPLNDCAILLNLSAHFTPQHNQQAHNLCHLLAHTAPHGVREIVPAYTSLTIHYDPLLIGYAQLSDWLTTATQNIPQLPPAAPRTHLIPVTYNGPDLNWVAQYTGLTVAQVIALHSSAEYTVAMLGFSPGFPYLSGLPTALQNIPRLANPRPLVPAGSVAIAGEQAGIYPSATPGGWRILGSTTASLFNPNLPNPFLLAPGDHIRFTPTAPEN